jgi:hypothetical protein
MAISTGDSVRKFSATTITLEANGAAIANNAIGQADDAGYNLAATDHKDADRALFVLTCTCAVAFNDMGAISIVVRPLNIDGTTDAPVPTASYPHRTVGAFSVKAQTASQTVECIAYDLPREGDVYLMVTAGQQMSTGWSLKMIPLTTGPA